MEFAEWEPVYEAILADFGYDRAGDERARDGLNALCRDSGREPCDPDSPSLSMAGETVAVAGAGPSLADETDRARAADRVVAASSAADVLLDRGVAVDLLVTDLDGTPETAVSLTHAGTPVAVHAHGDNLAVLREYVPRMATEFVLPTTQAEPAGFVRNFGGFTDGDRAAFLADHLGAGDLVFVGWDLDDPTVTETKRRKLRWAERLLLWLERRRGEQFSVLDGRREGIDTSMLPD